jgi:uncharacterized membrane protein (DUF373 family)
MARDPQEKDESLNQLSARVADWLEWGDQAVYIATGAAFLLIGCAIFVYSLVNFYFQLGNGFLTAILGLIHDLLLVLIIMEIMRTIITYFKIREILLEPFLHIGIIAATRRILTAGAQLTAQTSDASFTRYLWDTGINALVIVALGIAVFLFSRNRPGRRP